MSADRFNVRLKLLLFVGSWFGQAIGIIFEALAQEDINYSVGTLIRDARGLVEAGYFASSSTRMADASRCGLMLAWIRSALLSFDDF